MRRIRPAHVFLGVLTLAVAGKTGTLGYEALTAQSAGSVMGALSTIGAASAAGGAEEPKKKETDKAQDAPMAEPQICEVPEDVFAEITRERALLADERKALLEREAKIQLGQDKLQSEAQQLQTLKAALEGLLAKVEAQQNEDVDRLVNLYRNMKPKSAAGIINELDMEASVLVLATMSERDAAPILANLDPARARAISKIILERSKLPGDQNFSGIRLR